MTTYVILGVQVQMKIMLWHVVVQYLLVNNFVVPMDHRGVWRWQQNAPSDASRFKKVFLSAEIAQTRENVRLQKVLSKSLSCF